MLQHAQAFVFIYSNHHDGGIAMFGHGLWFAPRRLDDLTESILGILAPTNCASPSPVLLAKISV
jgi:hypothetical protein